MVITCTSIDHWFCKGTQISAGLVITITNKSLNNMVMKYLCKDNYNYIAQA